MISLKNNPAIGFIGTGVMGRGMVRNLLKNGYQVLVYNRTKASAHELLDEGAIWQDTVKDIANHSDIVITIVGDPADVEGVYFGADGILANARPGSIVIDMTTSTPSLAIQIYEEAKKREIYALDAPVSGGDVGAKNGTLAIMVGGDQEAVLAVQPVLEALGKNIVWQGAAGAGQHTKMCNQIVIASSMIGIAEAFVYAKHAGLDPERVLQSIGTGAAGSWSLSNLAPRMINGDFEPGFYVKHFVKDMTIALEEADKMGLETPGLELSKSLYERILHERNEGYKGTQVLYKLLDEISN